MAVKWLIQERDKRGPGRAELIWIAPNLAGPRYTQHSYTTTLHTFVWNSYNVQSTCIVLYLNDMPCMRGRVYRTLPNNITVLLSFQWGPSLEIVLCGLWIALSSVKLDKLGTIVWGRFWWWSIVTHILTRWLQSEWARAWLRFGIGGRKNIEPIIIRCSIYVLCAKHISMC